MKNISMQFDNIKTARQAADRLRSMGYGSAHVDILDRFTEEYSAEINRAGTPMGPSLSALVLRNGSHAGRPGMGPLLAADPMVSGLGRSDDAFGAGAQVKVRVEDQEEENVRRMLTEMKGQS